MDNPLKRLNAMEVRSKIDPDIQFTLAGWEEGCQKINLGLLF